MICLEFWQNSFVFQAKKMEINLKLSMVIGLIEALASAMKIPAIMYILIGLLSGKPTGKYIGGSVAIMVIAIVVDVICKRYSTVLQTEGGYNASAFMRIKIAEHLRYLPMGYFNSNSIGEISSITTNNNGNTWRCGCESGYADNAGNSGNINDHSYAVYF